MAAQRQRWRQHGGGGSSTTMATAALQRRWSATMAEVRQHQWQRGVGAVVAGSVVVGRQRWAAQQQGNGDSGVTASSGGSTIARQWW